MESTRTAVGSAPSSAAAAAAAGGEAAPPDEVAAGDCGAAQRASATAVSSDGASLATHASGAAAAAAAAAAAPPTIIITDAATDIAGALAGSLQRVGAPPHAAAVAEPSAAGGGASTDDTRRVGRQLRLAVAVEAALVGGAAPEDAATAALGRDEGSSVSVSRLWGSLLLRKSGMATGTGSGAVHAWYSAGARYWEGDDVPATVAGVLGGQEHIASDDVRESLEFLDTLASCGMQRGRALDCGAGIGRVARDVLLRRFGCVDVLEQSPKMVAQAARELAPWAAGSSSVDGRVGTIVCCGLQDLIAPAAASNPSAALAGAAYDCVWLQWVIGCVMDVDFVDLLASLAARLAPAGVIVLKDNVVSRDSGVAFQYDRADHSISRCRDYLDVLIARAGLRVVAEAPQVAWDAELLPVHMLALRHDPAAPAVPASPADTFRANLVARAVARAAAADT